MRFFVLLHILMALLCGAELKHIGMGNFDFSLLEDDYAVYDSKGKVMKLYREENNHNLTFMFSLILHDRTGSCSDGSMEEGSYEINGTTITLYSAWNRKGKAYDAPIGARIQVYELQPNATFKRTSSRLYIETQRKKQDKSSGMQYLFTAAKNKQEEKEFKAYISKVERTFNGTFVLGKEAKQLDEEVQEALARKMHALWH